MRIRAIALINQDAQIFRAATGEDGEVELAIAVKVMDLRGDDIGFRAEELGRGSERAGRARAVVEREVARVIPKIADDGVLDPVAIEVGEF